MSEFEFDEDFPAAGGDEEAFPAIETYNAFYSYYVLFSVLSNEAKNVRSHDLWAKDELSNLKEDGDIEAFAELIAEICDFSDADTMKISNHIANTDDMVGVYGADTNLEASLSECELFVAAARALGFEVELEDGTVYAPIDAADACGTEVEQLLETVESLAN